VTRQVTQNLDIDVTRIPLNNYYEDRSELSFDDRADLNYDHPSAFEWDLLTTHLKSLLKRRPIAMPQYDFETHTRRDERVTTEPTVVVKGILALYDPDLTEMMHLRLYVETDADVRILRHIRRDALERGRDLAGVID
jgi:uridine kinase